MKNVAFAAVAAVSLLAAQGASAALIADFELNGSLANSAGGGVTVVNNGGVLGSDGITFLANGGPTLSNLGLLSEYTLETRFSLDSIVGFRKLVDFKGLTSDRGLYNFSGKLTFFPGASATDPFIPASNLITLVLTRDASNLVTASINGTQQFSFTDTNSDAVINGSLHFFRDDTLTAGAEAVGGFVDYIRLSDGLPPGGIPEPHNWLLMVFGFASLGWAIRRHRREDRKLRALEAED